jgi:hypothetical protein
MPPSLPALSSSAQTHIIVIINWVLPLISLHLTVKRVHSLRFIQLKRKSLAIQVCMSLKRSSLIHQTYIIKNILEMLMLGVFIPVNLIYAVEVIFSYSLFYAKETLSFLADNGNR